MDISSFTIFFLKSPGSKELERGDTCMTKNQDLYLRF